jgi:hypothetical protein
MAQVKQAQGTASKPSNPSKQSTAKVKRSGTSVMVPSKSTMPRPVPAIAKDDLIFCYRTIAMVHGRLRIAHELIYDGLWSEALPHVTGSLEGLYQQLGPYMKPPLSIPGFNYQIKALAQAVAAMDREAYDAARFMLQVRVDQALDAVRTHMTSSAHALMLETVVSMLKVAQAKYEAAIDGEIFARLEDYQGGRGYVSQAQQIFESIAPELEAIDRKATDDIRWTFAELKSAWPRPLPPTKPAMSFEAVAARVARIEERVAALE